MLGRGVGVGWLFEGVSLMGSLSSGVDVLYVEMQRRLTSQVDQAKQLEGKANVLTGFAGLAATGIGSLGDWRFGMVAAGALALGTFWCAHQVLKPAEYAISVEPKILCDTLWSLEDREARLKLADTWADQIPLNDGILKRKAEMLDWELRLFLAFVLVLILGKLIEP